MADVRLDPYIFFAGTCREAMEFYRGVFSGELTMQTYAEAQAPPPEGMDDQALMHAKLDGPVTLMASDTAQADTHGHGKIHLSLSGEDADTLAKMFESLGEGGQVNDKLQKMPWGDTFGTVVDQFGVNWMVNIVSEENAQT